MRRVTSRKRASIAARTLLPVLIGVISAGVVAAIAAFAATPRIDDLRSRVDRSLQAHQATRTPLEVVAPQVVHALVAIEDERFYQHKGVDVQALLRALLSDLWHRRALEGGSTLTQQLVKNIYMDGDDDGWRKPENLVLAIKLESRFSKQEILESYLNVVYFGHGAYGIGQAASTYFAMPPDRLDLARASMLAGLPQAPTYYDLYQNPCAARARQYNVLAQMVHDGYITQVEATAAYSQPIGFPCR